MIAFFNSWFHLLICSSKRQLRSRKCLLVTLLVIGTALFLFTVGLWRPWTLHRFGRAVVMGLYALFLLPLVTAVFGTGAIGDERAEGTLHYLFTRPLPRWAIYLGKYLAVAPVALLFTIGGLWLFCQVARVTGRPEVAGAPPIFLPAALFATLAYLAFFHVLGAAFRRSTLIAFAYVFFIEVFVGRVPGILKRVTISFYNWSMLIDAGRARDLELSPHPRAIFLPIDGETSRWVLLGIAAGLLLLGAWLFGRREYRDG